MLRQVPTEWEVVDAYAVEPVRVYVEDDGATIVRLAPHEIVGAYTFDMAPPVPTRPPYRKRHSHDSSTSKSSNGDKTPPTSRRPSHTATRPELPDNQSTTAAIPIPSPRTESPSSLPASASSHSSTPKLTRLGSAFSFFRTNTHTHPRYDQRRREGSSSSSAEGSLSGSGSGSSDGDSEAVPRSRLCPRRRNSNKSTEHHAVAKSAVENPAYRKADLKRALTFARGELMKQVEADGKNALVLEGWSITVLRQAARYRINIEYTGRPAIISYSEQSHRDSAQRVPPFLEVIDEY